jgi:hypothetical protein
MIPLFAVSGVPPSFLFGSTAIALENLALRHQLAVLQRSSRRPRLSPWGSALLLGSGLSRALLVGRIRSTAGEHRDQAQTNREAHFPSGRSALAASEICRGEPGA